MESETRVDLGTSGKLKQVTPMEATRLGLLEALSTEAVDLVRAKILLDEFVALQRAEASVVGPEKVKFQVSARTARLIGRENVATGHGAIIELVKNCYDADSDICLVIFDNRLGLLWDEISNDHYRLLRENGSLGDDLSLAYLQNGDTFRLNPGLDRENRQRIQNSLSRLATVYVIDNGDGMNEATIRDAWMTIGTAGKEKVATTERGRVKSGAKGIGRFALDRLGSRCEMITFPKSPNQTETFSQVPEGHTNQGYRWTVNWEDFEGDAKTLESVNAELDRLEPGLFGPYLVSELSKLELGDVLKNQKTENGTILKISGLRDVWDEEAVRNLFHDLESLVPPKEQDDFKIVLHTAANRDEYGEILPAVCEDFDYKVTAHADASGSVRLTVIRGEYDVELIPPEFFQRQEMSIFPYRKDEFLAGRWETTTSLSQLIPGFADSDEGSRIGRVGPFDFVFYYLKKGYSTPDAKRFFYKEVQIGTRKEWLEKFGGIKLFRDEFRVRPYGEARSMSFDWLGLGGRKAMSPAGIAKKEGGYRVEPENVAGLVKISRIHNKEFEDKSSREGLQETPTFQVLKSVLHGIVEIFERDRAYIARQMTAFDLDRFSAIRNKEETEKFLRKILQERRDKTRDQVDQAQDPSAPQTVESTQLDAIAELYERKDEEVERLKEEQKLLRGLASAGIVLASFSHDLSKLRNVLGSRIDKLQEILSERISPEDFKLVDQRKNPFLKLDQMRHQDRKLQNWLLFSLETTRKDKRKRKNLSLRAYFARFLEDWSTMLVERGVSLHLDSIADIELRVFEIDFDSIFNNLLVNSLDVFQSGLTNRPREVWIKAAVSDKGVVLEYSDSGPGISPDIQNHDRIFEPLFTTKRNKRTGEEIGTGLGMWLVRSITEENDGKATLFYPPFGFGIRIQIPLKYKRG